MTKERQIVESVQLPPHFKFPNTWLLKFKKQVGISEKVIHGEETTSSTLGIETVYKHLSKILADYELEEVWNLDKTGLFYHTIPTRSLVTKSRKGGKLTKR